MQDAVLQVENLATHFYTDEGVVRAVDGVSFSVAPGETLGIVGESGSGKTVANLSLLRLIPQPPARIVSGRAWFRGADLLTLEPRQLQQVRGNRIAFVFQDPMTALNPFLSVARQLTETIEVHLGCRSNEARRRAVGMLQQVGIPAPARRIDDFPHQFSGGMRQRVMIAMALACAPDLVIADEPTTALDVTIQAQILELLKTQQRERGLAIILITHDLGVIANMCRRVCVMYAGRIVEEAPVDVLFRQPKHPYTLGLLRSVPRLDESSQPRLVPIDGQPPDLARLEPGCAFAPRCPSAQGHCRIERPELAPVGPEHRCACFFPA